VRDATLPPCRNPQSAIRNALHECCDRTWPLFAEGRKLWPMVRPEVRLSIRLFSLGGQRVLRLVEKKGYDTLNHRPKLSKTGKLWLMAGAMVNRWFAKGSTE
jgi:phytoene/squalene synthetase